ncbi:hypothetical protein P7B02_12655 [Caulobacter segnis]|uniref:hypothetical protein n=1 Tax=Caulobacter segnis TaxID=88688 RepID=UPI00240FD80D|nr:hypothetical protein [Caulobacter segnis]MDG2522396.1 hypothetical protein [Caulobacter segnis]
MRLTAALIALSLAAPALAQDAPTDVSPVTVMPAGDPPKLAGSYPAEGAEVVAGLLALKLTFDQPMDPKGWRIAQASPNMAATDGAAPEAATSPLDCLGVPRLLKDEKSFVVLCRTLPGRHYVVALNAPGAAPVSPDGTPTAFANLGGRSALPATLAFGTRPRGDDPVRTLKAAMSNAGLSDTDSPVVDTPQMR